MKTLLVVLLFSFGTLLSQELPSVSLENLDNETVNTTDLIQNTSKPVVFTFWATWCIPCLNELAAIHQVYDRWKATYEFDFYAVSTDDDRTVKKVKSLVNGKNWDFSILLDTNQAFKRKLNTNAIPYLIVVKDGKIIYKKSGFVKGDEQKIETMLAENQHP